MEPYSRLNPDWYVRRRTFSHYIDSGQSTPAAAGCPAAEFRSSWKLLLLLLVVSHIGEPYGGGRTRCANANQSAFREESWNRESARDPKAESRTRITARIVSLRAAHDTLRLRISVLRFFLRFSTCGTDSDDDDAQKCQESTSSKRHGDGLVFLSRSRANLLSLFLFIAGWTLALFWRFTRCSTPLEFG